MSETFSARRGAILAHLRCNRNTNCRSKHLRRAATHGLLVAQIASGVGLAERHVAFRDAHRLLFMDERAHAEHAIWRAVRVVVRTVRRLDGVVAASVAVEAVVDGGTSAADGRGGARATAQLHEVNSIRMGEIEAGVGLARALDRFIDAIDAEEDGRAAHEDAHEDENGYELRRQRGCWCHFAKRR